MCYSSLAAQDYLISDLTRVKQDYLISDLTRVKHDTYRQLRKGKEKESKENAAN
jgi:hypothetical protein